MASDAAAAGEAALETEEEIEVEDSHEEAVLDLEAEADNLSFPLVI